jgi:hypothetical protein
VIIGSVMVARGWVRGTMPALMINSQSCIINASFLYASKAVL